MFRRWLLAPAKHWLTQLEKRIMATQAELAAELRAMKEQNDKAFAEQEDALKKLQEALDLAGSTTPEVDEALEGLRASIQRDDDANPDAEQPEEPSNP